MSKASCLFLHSEYTRFLGHAVRTLIVISFSSIFALSSLTILYPHCPLASLSSSLTILWPCHPLASPSSGLTVLWPSLSTSLTVLRPHHPLASLSSGLTVL